MTVSELSILLVGSTLRSEFQEARALLERLGKVVAVRHVEAAENVLESGRVAPDLIVVAQAYPGQFCSEAIDRVRRAAPVAPVVALLGSWCEGEMRTGPPWPAATRVYWHQWPARCEQELDRLSRGICCSWGLPATASEEERLLAAVDTSWPAREGRIAIRSPEFEMQGWLAAACRKRGYATEWLRPPAAAPSEDVTAAIFDAVECVEDELTDLDRLAATVAPAPVIALLEFPRVEDRQRALAAGAAAVLSKPLLIDDLFWQMDRLLAENLPPAAR